MDSNYQEHRFRIPVANGRDIGSIMVRWHRSEAAPKTFVNITNEGPLAPLEVQSLSQTAHRAALFASNWTRNGFEWKERL